MKTEPFYINNFNIINTSDSLDLSCVPIAYRKRITNVDKVSLVLLFKTYNENIDEIVFSSIYGEFERLVSIIEQYQNYNEVSPIHFSGSVHNYPVGYFNLIKKLNIPYSATSSNQNTISMGLIKAILSKNKNVLFCYSDYFDGFYKGISFIISNKKLENSIEAKLIKEPFSQNEDEFDNLSDFLLNKKDYFKTSTYTIKRI